MATVPNRKVMISAAFEELPEHRTLLIAAIRKADCIPLSVATALLNDEELITETETMMHESAFYFGLITHQLGRIPVSPSMNSKNLSISEIERMLLNHRYPTASIIFMMSDEHNVTVNQIDRDPEKRQRLIVLREQLKKVENFVTEFHSLEDFGALSDEVPLFLPQLLKDHGSINQAKQPILKPGKPRHNSLYLAQVTLKNVRSIANVDLSFWEDNQPRSMSVFIGRNGAGKSSLLRAIAIGLCPQKHAAGLMSELSGDFIRHDKQDGPCQDALIRITLKDPNAPDEGFTIETRITRDSSGQEVLEQTVTPEVFPWERIFLCGYGVNRGSTRYSPIEDYKVEAAVRTLFDNDAGLLDPEAVLRTLKLAEHESTAGKLTFGRVIHDLKAVLRLKPSDKIEVQSKGIHIHGPWPAVPFHALGDGYRGTAGWFLDLLGHTYQAGFEIADTGPRGIVLLDEMDEHLHPKWQKELAPTLKLLFPELQFVGTTHAPMTIVNNQPNETFACHLENGVAHIEAQPAPVGKNADDILIGPWFDLDSSVDDETEAIQQNYHQAVLNGESEERLVELRKQLRQRMGNPASTPLEETAQRIVHEMRQDVEDLTESQRRDLIQEGLKRFKQAKADPG